MTTQAKAVLAGGQGVTTVEAARLVVDAIGADAPPTRYLIGDDARTLADAADHLSDHDLDEMLAAALAPPETT